MAIDTAAPPRSPRSPDACASCGAALAGDQRYCLQCGARRPELTPLYRQIARPRDTVAPATESPPDAALLAAGRAPINALAVVGCLLLAMGVGVLIGRSGNRVPRIPAAPAQVISVSTPGGATGPATAAAPATAKSQGAASSSSPKGAPAPPPKAIQALQNSTGKAYEQRSKNLPNVTTTGGTPPPIDHKPAGGGSGSVTIG